MLLLGCCILIDLSNRNSQQKQSRLDTMPRIETVTKLSIEYCQCLQLLIGHAARQVQQLFMWVAGAVST